ncbi:MAG: signal peptidase I [Bacteroidetes bacterium]|nr:signal peptidase I [Bacteroidota bacterium]
MVKKLRRIITYRQWLKATFFAFLVVLVLRTFLFEAYTIPTSSMEKTLQVGDFIFVNKLSYGARLPITPLSIPFSHQYIPLLGIRSYLTWIQSPYFRLPGINSIKRNDIIVFNYPMETGVPIDHRTHYIKRCIALPGDSIEINESKVFVNDSLLELPVNAELNYIIKTEKKGHFNPDSFAMMGITDGGRISGKGDYMFSLTDSALSRVARMNNIKEIKQYVDKRGVANDMVFPNDKKYSWNIDNWGPMKVPKAGDSTMLTLENLPLFYRIIVFYEKNELEIKYDSIYINGNVSSYYTFKKNYYFMLGDNRHSSADSRFWGFVPEDHIVGKAVYLFTSVDKSKSFFKKIRRERTFKSIE